MKLTITLPVEARIIETIELFEQIKKQYLLAKSREEFFELEVDFAQMENFDGAMLQFLLMLKKNFKEKEESLIFFNVSEQHQFLAKRWGANSLFQ